MTPSAAQDQMVARAGQGTGHWLELCFAGIERSVILPDRPELRQGLSDILRGWPYETRRLTSPDERQGDVLSALYPSPRDSARYDLASVYADEPLRNLPVASALCGVLADVLTSFADTASGAFTLHCGAFRIRDRLVALTGPQRAGKSTLIARLTAEPDTNVFCDDVLPIDQDGRGVGLGVAPRLRLPLPPHSSDLFHHHVIANLGPADDRYGYLCAPSIAPHGTRTPLAALVVLDRRESGEARLHRVEPDEAVHHLLARNMADLGSPEHAFELALSTIGNAACVKLVYADLEEAVTLLRRAFAGDDLPAAEVEIGPPLPLAPRIEEPSDPVDPDAVWCRADDAVIRRIGGSAFLWRPQDTTLWQLNQVAEMVWAALEVPGSAQDVVEVLADIFPDAPDARILEDVSGLLGRLARRDLARPGPAGGSV